MISATNILPYHKRRLLVVDVYVFLSMVRRFRCFSRKFRPYELQSTASNSHSRSRRFRSFARRFQTSNLTVIAARLRVFIPFGRPTIFFFLPCDSDLFQSSSLTLALTPTYSTPNPCIALYWAVILCELEH
jgi:hypothetical protein